MKNRIHHPRKSTPVLKISALCGLFVLLGGGMSAATTMVALDLEELTNQADSIVTARVLSSETRWNPQGTAIHTYTRILVVEKVKGRHDPGGVVTVLVPGGEVGEIGMDVPGSPRFTDGEEVLLFLEAPGIYGVPGIAGFSQGVFRVKKDPASGRKVVDRSLEGVEMQEAPSGSKSGALAEGGDLEAFLGKVRSIVEKRGRR